jgi:hypothetical protein
LWSNFEFRRLLKPLLGFAAVQVLAFALAAATALGAYDRLAQLINSAGAQ